MGDGCVYFVQIGKHIKIGFTRNLPGRLKAFETSAVSVDLLCLIPADRPLEKQIHYLLAEQKAARELFYPDYRINRFMDYVAKGEVDEGLRFLNETTPEARHASKIEARAQRTAAARLSRAEKNAFFARLVNDRKQRLGW